MTKAEGQRLSRPERISTMSKKIKTMLMNYIIDCVAEMLSVIEYIGRRN